MFSNLADIFGRVGLRKNMGKTVRMAFQTYRAIDSHSVEFYGLSIMGYGMTHRAVLNKHTIPLNRLKCITSGGVSGNQPPGLTWGGKRGTW